MSTAYDKRYEMASHMADELVELVKVKGEKYSSDRGDAYAYATGYIRSVLQSVAAQSPGALERLEESLRAARYQG